MIITLSVAHLMLTAAEMFTALLPEEVVCLENFRAWRHLNPCRGYGLSSLLTESYDPITVEVELALMLISNPYILCIMYVLRMCMRH